MGFYFKGIKAKKINLELNFMCTVASAILYLFRLYSAPLAYFITENDCTSDLISCKGFGGIQHS